MPSHSDKFVVKTWGLSSFMRFFWEIKSKIAEKEVGGPEFWRAYWWFEIATLRKRN